MAIKKIGLGGVQVSLMAGMHEAGLHFSVGGSLWRWLATRVAGGAIAGSRVAPALAPASAGTGDGATGELLDRVNGVTWYHTIDLGNGIRTPGAFDHSPILERYRLPERLDGKRVLDIATYDGFWAFEFERRGAKEVLAMDLDGPADLDWPPRRPADAPGQSARFGQGFAIAHEELGSSVQRVVCNVYDLSPETFGLFDVVHAGDLLLHLKSPVKALQNMARVCTDYALISEPYFPDLDCMGDRPLVEYRGGGDVPTWWKIGFNALTRMVLDAGFSRIEVLNTFHYGYRTMPGRMSHAVIQAFK
jgi:tRNA (mo5U34)-methyltransferase